MRPDFPLGECYICALIYLAQQPKVHIVQPARVLYQGTGYCRWHLPGTDKHRDKPSDTALS